MRTHCQYLTMETGEVRLFFVHKLYMQIANIYEHNNKTHFVDFVAGGTNY